MSVYGYIRVSSKDQKEDRQQIALKEVGVNLQNIYVDNGNVKKCAVGKYPKSEKLGSAGQAACCACTHSRYFTGGSPSGLRV